MHLLNGKRALCVWGRCSYEGNTLFARFILRVCWRGLSWTGFYMVFACKAGAVFLERWFHKWKNTLCVHKVRAKVCWMVLSLALECKAGALLLGRWCYELRGKNLDIYLVRTDSLWSYFSSMLLGIPPERIIKWENMLTRKWSCK